MRILAAFIMVLAALLPSRAATTWPASTNANQTFFGVETFSQAPILSSATASTVLKADAGKGVASIGNAPGALTNDSTGIFGWYPYFASFTDLNSASNSILNQVTNSLNSASNSILNQITGANIWTNGSGFIWPSGQPSPDTTGATAGPSILIATNNGSIFMGKHVFTDATFSPSEFALYGWSLVESNEPSKGIVQFGSANSTNYNYYAYGNLAWNTANSGGTIYQDLRLLVTNHPDDSSITASISENGPDFVMMRDGTNNFHIDWDGNASIRGVDYFWPLAHDWGFLMSDGIGDLVWSTNVNTITVLSNAYFYSNAYFFQTNIENTTIVTNLIVISNAYFLATNHFDTLVVSNTATVNQLDYFTNLCTMAPDFSKGYCWISTNAAFSFLNPIGFGSDQKRALTTVMIVTNSSGSPILATAPANVHVVPNSVMWITNATSYTFFFYPFVGTNVYGIPLF